MARRGRNGRDERARRGATAATNATDATDALADDPTAEWARAFAAATRQWRVALGGGARAALDAERRAAAELGLRECVDCGRFVPDLLAGPCPCCDAWCCRRCWQPSR